MTHTCTGVDVVVAEHRTHQFLNDPHFLVRATRRGDATDTVRPILRADGFELARREGNRFLPRDLLPGVLDARAYFRRREPV